MRPVTWSPGTCRLAGDGCGKPLSQTVSIGDRDPYARGPLAHPLKCVLHPRRREHSGNRGVPRAGWCSSPGWPGSRRTLRGTQCHGSGSLCPWQCPGRGRCSVASPGGARCPHPPLPDPAGAPRRPPVPGTSPGPPSRTIPRAMRGARGLVTATGTWPGLGQAARRGRGTTPPGPRAWPHAAGETPATGATPGPPEPSVRPPGARLSPRCPCLRRQMPQTWDRGLAHNQRVRLSP